MFDPSDKQSEKESVSPNQVAGYVLVAVGLTAIVVGLAWRQVVPDELLWSETDAQEYADAFEAAHAASIPHEHDHSHGGQDHEDGTLDLAEARERLARAEASLERARQMREHWGRILAVCGAVLTVAGAVALRRSS